MECVQTISSSWSTRGDSVGGDSGLPKSFKTQTWREERLEEAREALTLASDADGLSKALRLVDVVHHRDDTWGCLKVLSEAGSSA